MRATVSFAESALQDLEGIQAWYESEQVPEVGRRIVSEIFAQCQALADHPHMGRVVPEFDQRSLREVIHPPFRVVYKREAARVRIVRVWRSERLLQLPADPSPSS